MNYLEAIWLAEIHREAYVAILKSWVPHGKKGEFSHRCGITREYFSYLCALDSNYEGQYDDMIRYPSPGLAERMAASLPAPEEIKLGFIENMELS